MTVLVTSKKLGTHSVIMDDSDWDNFKDHTLYLWTTKRHTGVYVFAYPKGEYRKIKRLHRLLLGASKGVIVDHINGNPLDNRRVNLRATTSLGNNQNAGKRKDGLTSKYKRVCLHPDGKRYKAQIQHNKCKVTLGTHNTEIGAAKAYDAAAKKYHGEFARLNFPDEAVPTDTVDSISA